MSRWLPLLLPYTVWIPVKMKVSCIASERVNGCHYLQDLNRLLLRPYQYPKNGKHYGQFSLPATKTSPVPFPEKVLVSERLPSWLAEILIPYPVFPLQLMFDGLYLIKTTPATFFEIEKGGCRGRWLFTVVDNTSDGGIRIIIKSIFLVKRY